jgi:hypothetical protein
VADLKASIAAQQQAIVSQLTRVEASITASQNLQTREGGEAAAWRTSQHHLHDQMLVVLQRLDAHATRVHPSAAASAAALQATETDWMQLHDVVNQLLYSIMQRSSVVPVSSHTTASPSAPAAGSASTSSASVPSTGSASSTSSSVLFPALRTALTECTASKDDTEALRRAFTHIVDVLTASPAFCSTPSATSSLSAAADALRSARYVRRLAVRCSTACRLLFCF